MEARTDLEYRQWLTRFALMLALIVFALAFAAALASLGAEGTIRS